MPLPLPAACDESTSLREADLRDAAAAGRLKALDVYEIANDGRYFVVATLSRPRECRYLTTRRVLTRPRLFVLLPPLAELLRDIAPSLPFTVRPDGRLPLPGT